MIRYKNGDILTSSADVICHQVNCRGVMGAGLARQIAEKYPEVYHDYRMYLENFTARLGDVRFVNCCDGKIVASIFAQRDYGHSGLYTNYGALAVGFAKIAVCCHDKTIAIPYGIGCVRGGGDWNIEQTIINGVFESYNGDVEIWRLNK